MRDTFDIDSELETCRPKATSIAALVVGKTYADDVVQDAAVKEYNNRTTFDPNRASFSTWFLTIVVNTALDLRKKAWFQNDITGQFGPANDDDTPDEDRLMLQQLFPPLSQGPLEQMLSEAELYSYLVQLTEKERVIVSLTAEGATYNEMSGLLGLTVAALKMRVRRMRERLEKAQIEK
jgi:RNA polymerase sigma factor (sigma-70 family)